MNIGNRIQSLRKASGLSQEELAAKLFTTRQTVSQWETGQTVPTMENIYRLKEIFGVSFDELLEDAKEAPKSVALCDKFNVSHTKKECASFLIAANRSIMLKNLCIPICFSLVFLFVSKILLFDSISGYIFEILALFSLFLAVGQTVGFFRNINSAAASDAEKNAEYAVYEDKIVVTSRSDERPEKIYYIYEGSVKKLWRTKYGVCFASNGKLFSIGNSDIEAHQTMKRFLDRTGAEDIETNNLFRTVSVILTVIPLFLLLFCLYIMLYWEFNNLMYTFWIPLIFLPIPIASIVFGFRQKKKRRFCLKNIIVGIVVSALLIALCVVFGVTEAEIRKEGEQILSRYEEIVDVKFPRNCRYDIVSSPRMTGNSSVCRSSGRIYLMESAKRAFSEETNSSDVWTTDLPKELEDFLLGVDFTHIYLIYNETLKEYNTVPDKPGIYDFIVLEYDDFKGIIYAKEFQSYWSVPEN